MSGLNPVKCSLCSRWFRSHSGYTRHVEKQHANEQTPSFHELYSQLYPLQISSDGFVENVTSSGSSSDSQSSPPKAHEMSHQPTSPTYDHDHDDVQDTNQNMYFDSPRSSHHSMNVDPPDFQGEDVTILEQPRAENPQPSPTHDSPRDTTTTPPLNAADGPQSPEDNGPRLRRSYHPYINGLPCDEAGNFVDQNTTPLPPSSRDQDDWSPFNDQIEFEFTDLLYRQMQAPGSSIDRILKLWSEKLKVHGDDSPFKNHRELYETIDAISVGDAPWESFKLFYEGPKPNTLPPQWMDAEYKVWFRDPAVLVRNMLANPDFAKEFDYAPYQEYHGSEHRFEHFMSGDWAWRQADTISVDPKTHGSMFVPIILGSDKTTVSVATGHTEYWPVYLSIGNMHNTMRRAHKNGVALLGFLAIPKTDKAHADDAKFRRFRRQLFHTSMSRILRSLRPGMTEPEVVRCGDGYYRRAIYGIGPYIADYPEQCLIACIVQGWCPRCTAPAQNLDDPPDTDVPPTSRWLAHTVKLLETLELGVLWKDYGLVGDIVPFTEDFPRADIYELIAPDLLHQVIKGAFKDHFVEWIIRYIRSRHSERRANEILDDIDRRISVVPLFGGIRRFHHGRDFKQWTGDDSKALMKVYLATLEGYIPNRMIMALRNLLNFSYLVRREIHDTTSIQMLQNVHEAYKETRKVFLEEGVRTKVQIPRQHALMHYPRLIRQFGAPNGLCSSITESKHIKAVKDPWRRSNRYEALGQMLLTNQRLDKLVAARVDFKSRKMLRNIYSKSVAPDLWLRESDSRTHPPTAKHPPQPRRGVDDDDYIVDIPLPKTDPSIELAKTVFERNLDVSELEENLPQRNLGLLIKTFLRQNTDPAMYPPSDDDDYLFNITIVNTFKSAIATFYAPSDICGIHGMRRERIRATSTWQNHKGGRYDTVLVKTAGAQMLAGFSVARVRLFFSFKWNDRRFSCALVQDWEVVGDEPDETTGFWVVRRAHRGGRPVARVIALKDILRAVHLVPVYRDQRKIPRELHFSQTLDHRDFRKFYVNSYIDHHAFETLSSLSVE